METAPDWIVGAGGLLGLLFILLFVFIGAAVYFLPSIVAFARNVETALGVFVVNLFLGWTLLGWVVSLAWAVSAPAARRPTSPAHPEGG